MFVEFMYSRTSNKGPSEKGTTSQQRTLPMSLKVYMQYISTSEKRTASLQGTKCLVPKCPLARGSTVHIIIYSMSIVSSYYYIVVTCTCRYICTILSIVSSYYYIVVTCTCRYICTIQLKTQRNVFISMMKDSSKQSKSGYWKLMESIC